MRNPWTLRNEACTESYEYFDKNIRILSKHPNGGIDERATGLHNNDVDAFRHAFVSGVFTQEYNERTADVFGQLNELFSFALRSQPGPGEKNMDLWNNAVGRKYGKKAKTRKELADFLKRALESGELMTTPNDPRRYVELSQFKLSQDRPVIVAQESATGRNEAFIDLATKASMSRAEFVAAIKAGKYPSYRFAMIRGVETPLSKADDSELNNLT